MSVQPSPAPQSPRCRRVSSSGVRCCFPTRYSRRSSPASSRYSSTPPGARATYDRTRIVLIGALIGATALVRGEILVLLLVAPVWWALMGIAWLRSIRLALVMASTALVCIAPWFARNAILFGSPTLTTSVGYDLRVGHAPYATGRYVLPQDLWAAGPATTFTQNETVFNDLGRRRAVGYAVKHPAREIELAARKMEWLWRPDSDVLIHVSSNGLTPLPRKTVAPLRLLLDVTYVLLVGLAAATLVWVKTSVGRLLLPCLIVFVWSVVHVVFFGEPRYHLPLLAVISPMAGATVIWLWDALSARLVRTDTDGSTRRASSERGFVLRRRITSG